MASTVQILAALYFLLGDRGPITGSGFVFHDQDLVFRTSLAFVHKSNGLIRDLVFLAPARANSMTDNNLREYRSAVNQFVVWTEHTLISVSVFPCDKPATVISSLGSGKTLIVNTCVMNSSSAISLASDLKQFSGKSVIHLLILSQNLDTTLRQHDSTLRHLGLNHFFVGELTGEGQDVERRLNLYEFFRPTNQSRLLSTLRFTRNSRQTLTPNEGVTNLLSGEDAQFQLLSEVSRSDFQSEEFRVGAVMDETYVYDTNITQVQVRQGRGRPNYQNETLLPIITYEFHDSFAVEILRVLQSSMNFTTIPVVTDAWGHLGPDGTSWRGMIWYLLHDKVDLAISSTADRPFRHEVVDFNMPTSQIRLSAFFKTPKSVGGSGSGVAQPFSRGLWCVLALWVFIAGVALVFFKHVLTNRLSHRARDRAGSPPAPDRTESSINRSHDPDHGYGFDGTLWSAVDCFQWVLSSFCMQSYHNLPTLAPYRILIGAGYMLSIIVYAAYSSTLISFLSVVVEPIRSLEQLIGAKFAMNIVDNPLPLAFLSESQNEYAHKIYEKRKPEPKLSSMSQAAKLLNTGRFAFLVDHMNGYESLHSTFTIQEACEIREIEIPYARQQQSSMVAKNSTVKRLIDYQILRMFEFGLIGHWRRRYLQSKPNCDGTAANNFEGVNVERLGLIYRIFCAGFVLAVLLLGLEVWHARRRAHAARDHKLIEAIK